LTPDKIKEMLDMLNTLNEYFLSLPDDMLLNIDPRDNESLEQGSRFIKSFNDNLSIFSNSALKIEEQIKEYFSINPEEDEIVSDSSSVNKVSRVIKVLDKSKSHTLDENLTYKRPYGFILGKSAYKGLKTWKSLYIQVLKELNHNNSTLFLKLPEENKFISNRGNQLFSRNKNELRSSQKILSDFFVETNLSANQIKKTIVDLLNYFGIDYTKMKIYLREDRDAQF